MNELKFLEPILDSVDEVVALTIAGERLGGGQEFQEAKIYYSKIYLIVDVAPQMFSFYVNRDHPTIKLFGQRVWTGPRWPCPNGGLNWRPPIGPAPIGGGQFSALGGPSNKTHHSKERD